MFVMSVKGNTLKITAAILAAAIVITALVVFLPVGGAVSAGSVFEGKDTVNYDKIKTNENRIEFLRQFGWEPGDDCIEEAEIKIPADFDKIMKAYNEVQKAQGFNLDNYKGKTAMRYTYEIKNYPDYDGKVFANIIIYKNRVIGGDICSSDVDGFIHGFEKQASSE
ncbi:MAG: DUF4830 domain-containing protein [Clostridia bacterium]|nr:DUF4830 domain-containing protein [Clostridia bacterium]